MKSSAERCTLPPDANGRVLVVDDHAPARESMAEVLREAGHEVTCCSSAAEALRRLAQTEVDCVVTDLKMPGMSGLDFIVQIEQRRLPVQVVMVTAHASVASAVAAMRHGAFDYIEKPFDVEQLERLVAQAIRHGRLFERGRQSRQRGLEPPLMVGRCAAMQALHARITRVAPTPETVLITGESGTGKELVARAIHNESPRAAGPLVSLNCPVLSAQLMESELFGHERGAFTGADSPRAGRFEMAHQGTIFLDEVTEIDLNLQAKLLRVLQERAFERVGSSRTQHVDVRVVASTNRDLEQAVREGRFREDLYFRLAVVPVPVPPLRDRRDDIPALCEHFFTRCAQRIGREPCALEPAALDLLVRYDWPGNVRELENIATRVSVLNEGGPVTAGELQRWLAGDRAGVKPRAETPVPVGTSLQEMEQKLIEATLHHFNGHRERTAQALGIGVRTLSGKLRQYGYAPREKEKMRA